MNTKGQSVVFDGDISSLLLNLVDDAKKELTLVSPYWSIGSWRHMSSALMRCAQRSVKIVAFVRDEPEQVKGKDVALLKDLGAQIYLNEQGGLISSMNLTETSTRNSSEVALCLNTDQVKSMREYISTRLVTAATPLNGSSKFKSASHGAGTPSRRSKRTNKDGHCIRCGTNLPLDPDRPLCENCYDIWSEWANPDYTEKVCHLCGCEERVTYAKPLCRRCYQAVTV